MRIKYMEVKLNETYLILSEFYSSTLRQILKIITDPQFSGEKPNDSTHCNLPLCCDSIECEIHTLRFTLSHAGTEYKQTTIYTLASPRTQRAAQ